MTPAQRREMNKATTDRIILLTTNLSECQASENWQREILNRQARRINVTVTSMEEALTKHGKDSPATRLMVKRWILRLQATKRSTAKRLQQGVLF